MKNFFDGYYVKCTSGEHAVAFIFGKQKSKEKQSSFVQIITKEKSFYFEYDYNDYAVTKKPFSVRVGANLVDASGMVSQWGNLSFGEFTPIKYDAMGPFKFLPFMECRHKIISMNHKVNGQISIEGEVFDFLNADGYIEGDVGKSFPKKYFWSQSNSFDERKLSVVVSCAKIPYLGLRFKGSICVVSCDDKEYRLATYLGARVKEFNKNQLIIKQGLGKRKKILSVEVLDTEKNTRELLAPIRGKMDRVIYESLCTDVRYKMTIGKGKNMKTLFDITSSSAYEYSE